MAGTLLSPELNAVRGWNHRDDRDHSDGGRTRRRTVRDRGTAAPAPWSSRETKSLRVSL